MSIRRLLLLFAWAIAAANAGAAKVEPNNARGFGDKVFQMGELDTVNVFNGHLSVRIPLGTNYTSGPSLPYQFVLTYNSRVWDYEFTVMNNPPPDPKPYKRRAVPERESNAGLGWTLSVGGRLLPPEPDTYTTAGHGWIYIAPDGSHHEFRDVLRASDPIPPPGGPLYTTDGSYLRLTLGVSPSPHVVEFPDGTRHEYLHDGRLAKMYDRFDNWVKVAYDSNLTWTITDGHGTTASSRSHVVRFADKASKYSQTNFQQVVSSVELAAFDGSTATYTFRYADDPSPQPTMIDRGTCGDLIVEDPAQVPAPLLESVTLPDNARFLMTHQTADVVTCSSGALTRLTLPTHGAIAWQHGEYTLPLQECNTEDFWTSVFAGVVKRSFFQPGTSTAESVWTYTPAITFRESGLYSTNCGGEVLNLPLPPEEYTNTIINPAGDKTVHFFSVYPPGAHPGNSARFKGAEYGLPFTRHDELEPGGRALSSATYDCTMPNCSDGGTLVQKTYVLYENDGHFQFGNFLNNRLRRRRVTEQQDTGCSGVCYTDTDHDDFDGYGHYRKTTLTSNGALAVSRTTFTNFNPGSSSAGRDGSGNYYFLPGEPWLLQTYDHAWVREGPAASKSVFAFDSTTGVLISSRNLKLGLIPPNTDPSLIPTTSNDLLTVFCRDGSTAGVRGFVTSERRVGGDVSAIPPNVCSASRSDGHYFLDHSYTFTNALLTAHTAAYAGSSFLTLDETLDGATGLVRTSRDTAGLATSYKYDTSGRMIEMRPAELAWTRYVYDRSAYPVKIDVEMWPFGWSPTASPISDTVRDDHFYFDGFGRLLLSKTRMPATDNAQRWAAARTKYDAMGRAEWVSTPMTRTTPGYEVITPSRTTSFSYDALGRTIETVAPDATRSRTEFTGTRLRRFRLVEADGTSRLRSTEEWDALGRLVRVTEPSGNTSASNPFGADITTSYEYDLADRLGKVETVAGGIVQTRRFVHDTRGWLLEEMHPEKGSAGNGAVTYSNHDAAGNARQRTEGSGAEAITVTFDHDSAARLTAVRNGAGQLLKRFEFATANDNGDLRKGKLWKAVRYNRLNAGTIVVTETYKYTGRGGRVGERDTTVELEGGPLINTFSQSFWYEAAFGLPQSIGYPTCTGCPTSPGLSFVNRIYDRGFLETVPNFAVIGYHPTGMVASVERAGSGTVVDTYTADSEMGRPGTITFTGLTSCTPPPAPQIQAPSSVLASSAGNVASIVSPVAGVTYEWSITGGTIAPPPTGSSIQFTAGASGTVVLTVRASTSCGSASPVSRTITIHPLPPASVTATSNNREVTVTWPQVSGAASYQVERATSRSGTFQLVGSTPSLSLIDTVPASATPVTYIYRVRSVDSAGTPSRAEEAPTDFATTATLLFADSMAGGVPIRASQIAELQHAIDALRVATSTSLPPLFSGAPSLAGQPITASAFTSLIDALDGARGQWGLPPFAYSGHPPPAPGGVAHNAYIAQLREAVK